MYYFLDLFNIIYIFFNFASMHVDIYSVCVSSPFCYFSWCMSTFYQALLQTLDLFVWYVLVCLLY